MQETHSISQDQKIWASEWPTLGVLILFKRAYNPQILNTMTDLEGRYIVTQLKRQTETFTLFNVYTIRAKKKNWPS